MHGTRPDIARCVHRPLLEFAAYTWACYLVSLLRFWLSSEFARGVLTGGLGGALVLGTIVAGASLWASFRVRTRECYLAVAVSVPLSALAWWDFVFWHLPN
jgi:hypothetical protein